MRRNERAGGRIRSEWSDLRLSRLATRYNRRYFEGRVRNYTFTIGELRSGLLGLTDDRALTVTIDPTKHKNDRDIRSTLLHEMAHVTAATSAEPRDPHDSNFLAEIERLLALGAPVSVDCTEAGRAVTIAAIPAHFVRVRRRLKRAFEREQSSILALQVDGAIADMDVQIEDEFHNLGLEGDEPWDVALAILGPQYGLTDVDGVPLAGSKKIVQRCHTAFNSGRATRHWARESRRR